MIGLHFVWQKPDCIFIIHLLGYHSPPHYFYDVDSSFPPAFPPLNSHSCSSSSFPFILPAVMFIVHQLNPSPVPTSPYSCLRLRRWSQIWCSFKGRKKSIMKQRRRVQSWTRTGMLLNWRHAGQHSPWWCWFIVLRAKSYCGLLHKYDHRQSAFKYR